MELQCARRKKVDKVRERVDEERKRENKLTREGGGRVI
jgi:hypothetical protein